MPIDLTDADGHAARRVARDEELVLRLAENPTTGYRWQFSQSGDGELALVADQYLPGAAPAAPGAAGHRVMRFTARQPGQVQLQLQLKRAWEPAATPLDQRLYSIEVA